MFHMFEPIYQNFDPTDAFCYLEWFFSLSLLFVIGGVLGWVIELFFRRFAHKKWVNPGFLSGPFLPLYGFGNVAMYVVFSLPYEWAGPTWVQYLVMIVFVGILMTLIEFIAGLIFIKGMKIKLWDYSNLKGNIMGIICPLFSAIWLFAGAAYLFLVFPPFTYLVDALLPNMLYLLFFVGLFYGVLFTDLGYSFHLATRIKKAVSDSDIAVNWESFKEKLQEKGKEFKQKTSFLFPFASSTETRKSALVDHLNELKQKGQNLFRRDDEKSDTIEEDRGK